MSSVLARLALVFALLCGALPAQAQIVPEREVEIIQSLFDTGKFAEAARRATESLAVANFTDTQRVKLHEIAGISSFNLGDTKAAQASFLQLLRINPDYILDPFAVPPPAIRVFDQVRKENADALNLVRQQIALRLDQEKREAAERERIKKEQEERKRRSDLLNNEIVVRSIEKHSMLVNFIPFGAGQFQQGRIGWGSAFAVSEGLMAILSIVSYFAIEALYVEVDRTFTNVIVDADGDGKPDPNGTITVQVRQIPSDRRSERDVWTGIKYGTGIAFYALWALGIGDAIWHHQDETVTEKREPITPAPPTPTARFRLYPTNGGLGAGVTIKF